MPRIQKLEEIYMEGWMDRQRARLAGLGGGAKAIGGNIKNVFTGDQNINPKEAARAARLDKIVDTFAKDITTLFPDANLNEQLPKILAPIYNILKGPSNVSTQVPEPAVDETPFKGYGDTAEIVTDPNVELMQGLPDKPAEVKKLPKNTQAAKILKRTAKYMPITKPIKLNPKSRAAKALERSKRNEQERKNKTKQIKKESISGKFEETFKAFTEVVKL